MDADTSDYGKDSIQQQQQQQQQRTGRNLYGTKTMRSKQTYRCCRPNLRSKHKSELIYMVIRTCSRLRDSPGCATLAPTDVYMLAIPDPAPAWRTPGGVRNRSWSFVRSSSILVRKFCSDPSNVYQFCLSSAIQWAIHSARLTRRVPVLSQKWS